MASRKFWCLCCLFFIVLLNACGTNSSVQNPPSHPFTGDNILVEQHSTPVSIVSIPQQINGAPPTPTVAPAQRPGGASPTSIPTTGSGLAPYGPPPAPTAEETQLTQELFNLINHDRAVRGLYPFVWNDTLAAGARLHSWNMKHCGFSHTCPDGEDQCTRIANEGFAGFTDCGECIGLAGPSNPPWSNVYSVQESMINEPPTGWHRIHLTSTTLHKVGVGIYVDSSSWVWFTEDLVS